jgi:glutamyl-tRNA synthetase
MKTPTLRIAPSPTGELHIGSLGMAVVNYMLAKSMGGKFNIRIEDTDQKRQVDGADLRFIAAFEKFGLEFANKKNIPYQSTRGELYQKEADKLVKSGKAYLDEGCVRLKSNPEAEPIKFTDLIKGNMILPPLDRDPVILKSTGIPPYNLAHIVDDLAMGTTHVVRGEEWLASTAEHIQIYEAIHGDRNIPWQYAHMPVICIIEDGNKRKLSKRKDKEALVEHFLSVGYPIDALVEYLLTIYNTDYEIWRNQNPEKHWKDFHFRFEKIGSNSPLFDWDKLNSISSTMLSKMKIGPIMAEIRAFYGNKFTPEQYEKIQTLLNIDRGTDRPRKDITRYADIETEFNYVFRPVKMSPLLKKYKTLLDAVADKDMWFNECKTRATEFGFKNVREFTQALRVELTGRERSTDLYTISKILLGTLNA